LAQKSCPCVGMVGRCPARPHREWSSSRRRWRQLRKKHQVQGTQDPATWPSDPEGQSYSECLGQDGRDRHSEHNCKSGLAEEAGSGRW
jgi:hypothetical protein